MPIVSLLVACLVSSALTPLVIYFANKYKIYDRINERKIHNGNIPRLGGVGIAAAFMAAFLVTILLERSGANELYGSIQVWPIFATGFALFLLGLVDDLIDLRALFKFTVQTLSAVVLIAFGFRFRVIMVPWGDGLVDLGLFSYPLTLAWIIGVTNSINLIDGLDGLASGVSIVVATTFAVFYWVQGMPFQASICLAIVGSAIGFLFFNRNPARIFMGDSGSLFLGFCLAMLPLLSQRDDGAEIGLISAATALAIPIYDTLTAIYRRKRAHVSFFTADKAHFHHILLRKFDSTTKAVMAICFFNTFLCMIAMSTLVLPRAWSFSLKLLTLLAVGLLFFSLNARRERESDGSRAPR